MLTAEHTFQFGLIDLLLDDSQVIGHLGLCLTIIFLNRHLQQQMRLFDFRPGFLPAFYHLLELPKLLLNFTGTLTVRPEIGSQRLPFQPFNLFFFCG